MRTVIFINTDKKHAEKTAAEAAKILRADGINADIYNIESIRSDIWRMSETDVIIVVGGDGTILKASGVAAENDIPLLGINTGRLGFMASIERTEPELLHKLSENDYRVSVRMRIVGEVRRGGDIIMSVSAANEVSAVRPMATRTEFTVRAAAKNSRDFHTVCGFRADGVLVATPTGSTAYALANGGAIIEPNAHCMELTPICAHSLSMRPMIFASDAVIAVSHELPAPFDREEPLHINADGVCVCKMIVGDTLTIRKADKSLTLIDLKPNSFYESVNGKLFQSLK